MSKSLHYQISVVLARVSRHRKSLQLVLDYLKGGIRGTIEVELSLKELPIQSILRGEHIP